MKKHILTVIVALACMFLTTNCAMYGVTRNTVGNYQSCALNDNKLTAYVKNIQEWMNFNLVKYWGVKDSFYGAKVYFIYAQKEYSPGDNSFDIKERNGVIINVNGGRNFYPRYRGGTEHTKQLVRSGYGGSFMHIEQVECILTLAQIQYMVQAKSIVITIVGETPNPKIDKTQMYYFSPDNFKIMQQFYDEEIKGSI